MVPGPDDRSAVGEAEGLKMYCADTEAEGLIKLFEEVRSGLEATRTLNALAGKPWWTSTEAKRFTSKLPKSTALSVPVRLLRISKASRVDGIAAIIRASIEERDELCLWLQGWLFDGDMALGIGPESGCYFTIEPIWLMRGIINGEVQLDWKAMLEWRDRVLNEPLFPGL